jgi:hypothetical protein
MGRGLEKLQFPSSLFSLSLSLSLSRSVSAAARAAAMLKNALQACLPAADGKRTRTRTGPDRTQVMLTGYKCSGPDPWLGGGEGRWEPHKVQ